jgi:late competence protein required for DNA uptake (superfamily II DNA/RNA helicase)
LSHSNVTGAGKTEMMFQGIQYARRQGDNIAIVSPRVDVVVEISKRINAYNKIVCLILMARTMCSEA